MSATITISTNVGVITTHRVVLSEGTRDERIIGTISEQFLAECGWATREDWAAFVLLSHARNFDWRRVRA